MWLDVLILLPPVFGEGISALSSYRKESESGFLPGSERAVTTGGSDLLAIPGGGY